MAKIHYKPLSRYFPATHPKAGLPTHFVEKLWESLDETKNVFNEALKVEYLNYMRHHHDPKFHTIRRGDKVKPGDFIQFYVWEGKPYRSKWIYPCQPVEIVKIWPFEHKLHSTFEHKSHSFYKLFAFYINGIFNPPGRLIEIAKNDGLELKDFKAWFSKPFTGQILCWNETINY